MRAVVLPDRRRVLTNVTNGTSGRAVAQSVLDGRLDDAQAMLIRDPRLLTTVVAHDARMDRAPGGQYGDLLTLAVATCSSDAVAMLIARGMPPDGVQPGQALTLALLADTPVLAERLLRGGASPDPQTLPGGRDAMAEAIAFGHAGAVMMLLRHGADPRWHDAFGSDRLRQAVDAEQLAIAELLAEVGASLWSVTDDGSMAAHVITRPAVVFSSPVVAAARARLVERAKASGLPWPPPPRTTVRAMFASGQWPTPAMTSAGMLATPAVLARLRPTQ